MHGGVASWAWILVGLAGLNLLIQGGAAAWLLWQHLRRHRPLLQLAEAILEGDLDVARFLLASVNGPAGRELTAICRATIESGPPATARNRFLRAYLVAYPAPPLAGKLAIAVGCGTAALLPFLVAAAGRMDLAAAAAEQGAGLPRQALDLYRLGFAETVAASMVAWALVLVSNRLDPDARFVRRRLVARLTGEGTSP